MKKNGKDNRPSLRPVTRIELSEKNTRLRWILAVVFLAIGVSFIAMGVASSKEEKIGWQTVEVMSDYATYADDFVFMYEYSKSGTAAITSEKLLVSCYTTAMEQAYRAFHPYLIEEGLHNVAYLNAHVNEIVTVDAPLYDALALAALYENRHIFLGAAAEAYSGIFLCDNDIEAASYDPQQDAEAAQWLEILATYAGDPQQIRLEILSDSQVRLVVSDAYLAFAQENEVTTFLDFNWMRNAFIIDYVAQQLQAQGFTCGYLASFDGFTRNLDVRGEQYSYNIFDRQGNDLFLPARMQYQTPMSIVFLRNYAMSESDTWHYYTFATGNTVTPYLDPQDGWYKSARNNLVCYSGSTSCAEVLLQIVDVYVADEFRPERLQALQSGAVYSIWFDGTTFCYNDEALAFEKLTEDYTYTLVK